LINFGALRGALTAGRFGRGAEATDKNPVPADASEAHGLHERKPADPVWTLGSTASLAGRIP
jgi:hypothetical protein